MSQDISQNEDTISEETEDNVFTAVGDISSHLQKMETFFSRRFDELSMEINATSQQVDMAEEGIITRFSEVLEVLKAVSFSGDGKTPANAGVELGAVVDMTEEAANTILDATNNIKMNVASDVDWSDEASRAAAIKSIEASSDEIFMACSFQDITGQRIRKTLENLKEIEDRLNNALTKMGVVVEVKDSPPIEEGTYATSQSDIDALFDDL